LVAQERRAREPLLPPALFHSSVFNTANVLAFLLGISLFGSISFLPLVLQIVIGMSASFSGLLLLPLLGGQIVASVTSGADRQSHRPLPHLSNRRHPSDDQRDVSAVSDLDSDFDTASRAFDDRAGRGNRDVHADTHARRTERRRGPRPGCRHRGHLLLSITRGSVGVALFGAILSSGLVADLGALSGRASTLTNTAPARILSLQPARRTLIQMAYQQSLSQSIPRRQCRESDRLCRLLPSERVSLRERPASDQGAAPPPSHLSPMHGGRFVAS
jgi:hypothetical protein